MIFFRDYGLFDHAMLRFSPGHKLCENFYVRQDGTRAYYFSTGKTRLIAGSTNQCGVSALGHSSTSVHVRAGSCVH